METLNIITIGLLNTRNPIVIILVLALLCISIATPFSIILRSYSRHIKTRFPVLYLFAPIAEELVFRTYLLGIALSAIEPLTAVVISTVAYTIYMQIFYGTSAMAEGIVTGIIFGLAFLQFGIIPVIAAHIIYRAVLYVW